MAVIDDNTLGNNIRNARIKRGLSQEYLAKAIGVTKAAVSRYESGTREPRSDQLKAIARELNVTVAYLEGFEAVDVLELARALKRKDYQAVEKIMDLPEGSIGQIPEEQLETLEYDLQESTMSAVHFKAVAECIKANYGEITTADRVWLIEMIEAFSQLNEKGQMEAINRVEDLVELPWYKKKGPPQD